MIRETHVRMLLNSNIGTRKLDDNFNIDVTETDCEDERWICQKSAQIGHRDGKPSDSATRE
jgi:hypothetical protein